ncbi:MAG: hypothetical protein ACRD6N_17025 [Pyrinomonadaceae bacterium]
MKPHQTQLTKRGRLRLADLPLCGIFGVRRQSEAATALWMFYSQDLKQRIQSCVALRLPPHSKESTVLKNGFQFVVVTG